MRAVLVRGQWTLELAVLVLTECFRLRESGDQVTVSEGNVESDAAEPINGQRQRERWRRRRRTLH